MLVCVRPFKLLMSLLILFKPLRITISRKNNYYRD